MNVMIEVKSTEIDTRSGRSQRTGRDYTIRTQDCYLHTGKVYPELIKITLDDNQRAYPEGMYTISPESFYQGKFNSLGFRPKLIPAKAAAAVSPARATS